jgi:hypothetical protein
MKIRIEIEIELEQGTTVSHSEKGNTESWENEEYGIGIQAEETYGNIDVTFDSEGEEICIPVSKEDIQKAFQKAKNPPERD